MRQIALALPLALTLAALTAVPEAAAARAAPQVLSVLPALGLAGGGAEVTVLGKGFIAGDRVLFGGEQAQVVRVRSATRLTAFVPAGAGTVAVEVVGGTGTGRLDDAYSYVRWQPAPLSSWQLQLENPPTARSIQGDATVYDIDGFDTSAATVAALHSRGVRAVCYIDAGTWENWRPDAGKFPRAILGAGDGWPGERWLDIRDLAVLEPLMAARLQMCKAKGFDAVDPDNVNAWDNQTGFPISASDQLRYDTWLSRAAHSLGLAIGLKNDYGQVAALAPSFDFAVDEQCFEYGECQLLRPFLRVHKPVFEVEYGLGTQAFCARADALGLNAMRKELALGPTRTVCWQLRPQPPFTLQLKLQRTAQAELLLAAVRDARGQPVADDSLAFRFAEPGCGDLHEASGQTDAQGIFELPVSRGEAGCTLSALERADGAAAWVATSPSP